jgi:branched-chain amino acid aminotransferase
MSETCYINGEWRAARDAHVHLFDSGIMYGDTLTETLRTFDGAPFEVDRHLDRLRRSAQGARITLDPGWHLEALVAECAERGLRAHGGEVLIKVDVTRGVFDYYRDPKRTYPEAHLYLHAIPLPFWRFAAAYANGTAVAYPNLRQLSAQTLDPRIKHRSRLFQALAEREARDVDPAAAALLLCADGYIAEGTGSNVFAARNGELLTPTTENCLAGVSRAVVLDLARELGITARETRIRPYDLETADELFSTATSYCLLPIVRVHGKRIGDGHSGPIVARLLRAWSDHVGVDIVRQATAMADRQQATGSDVCRSAAGRKC